jgi:ribosome-associated protein
MTVDEQTGGLKRTGFGAVISLDAFAAARFHSPRPAPHRFANSPSSEALPMNEREFRPTGSFIELNQLLKLTGVCASGGAGKALVAQGGVRVDGQPESRKTCKIRAGQVVEVGNVRIRVLAGG